MAEGLGKILIVICDGMADRPAPGLGKTGGIYMTPLQAAQKKAMDGLASGGICGMMDPIDRGIRPGSDTAHLALLGYDPFEVYTGRGPFEALGEGMEVMPGDVAFRCNFATVDRSMKVTDRRAGRISEGTSELARALDGITFRGVKVIFRESVEHRAVLILRSNGSASLSAEVTDVDPHKEGEVPTLSAPMHGAVSAQDAKFTSEIVNEFVRHSHKVLDAHPINLKRAREGKKPANIVLPRGAGMAPHIESIHKLYGLRSSCIAGISLVKGICRYVGMAVIDVKGATGGKDTDIEAKFDAAISALSENDLVLMNIKGCDIFGHDGDATGKSKFISKIDTALGKALKDIDENTVVAITADHSTPVTVRDHSGDPVPVVVCGAGVRPDSVKHFDELSCISGGLGRMRGKDLLPTLLDLVNRSEKFGA